MDAAREIPRGPALWFKGRTITWRDLARDADACACAFAELGVGRGDRVVLVLPNCPQFVISEFGAWRLGAIVCPLNPAFTSDEIAARLQALAPRVVITLDPFYERVKAASAGAGVERIVATSIKDYFPLPLRAVFTVLMERRLGHRVTVRPGDARWNAFLGRQRGERITAPLPGPEDDAMILYSGGTTGTPKGVPAWHKGLIATAVQFRAWAAGALQHADDGVLLPLPLFHSYAASLVQGVCITGRHPLGLIPDPRNISDVVRSIARFRPVVFCGVPTLYNAILSSRKAQRAHGRFRSVRLWACGAAPLMAETRRRFEKLTGARVTEAWGLTESLIAACGNPVHGVNKVGSVGLPLPDVHVKVVHVDHPGRELPDGEVGEVLLRGPQVMRGYFDDPGESAAMLFTCAEGHTWLRTADLGYLDADGYLFIVDRKKDLIKANGMQVWPREVEEALATHPAVADVGVRGFPDAARGEVAVAFVVLRAGMRVTEPELRAYCKERMAFYKVPSRVIFRSALPKSLVGKVLRRMLTLEEAGTSA